MCVMSSKDLDRITGIVEETVEGTVEGTVELANGGTGGHTESGGEGCEGGGAGVPRSRLQTHGEALDACEVHMIYASQTTYLGYHFAHAHDGTEIEVGFSYCAVAPLPPLR